MFDFICVLVAAGYDIAFWGDDETEGITVKIKKQQKDGTWKAYSHCVHRLEFNMHGAKVVVVRLLTAFDKYFEEDHKTHTELSKVVDRMEYGDHHA